MKHDIIKNTKRVIFCSDILRINNDNIATDTSISANINMIYRLFAPLIQGVLLSRGRKVEISTLYGTEGGFSSAKFSTYRQLGLPMETASWAFVFANSETQNIIDMEMDKYFSEYDLVLCYETPPYLISYFLKRDIPFLDIRIHAVRFLNDYMFSFFSNIPDIQNKLEKLKIKDDVIYRMAMMISARSAMIFRNPPQAQNNVLFLGQTVCDSSLISHDRLASQDDVIEAISRLATIYETVYYKIHPYNRDKELIQKIVSSCSSCKIFDHNVYDGLSLPFEKIASLSSGTNVEAKYFGKNAIWMLNDLHIPYEGTTSIWKTIPIFKYPFFVEFWEYILTTNEKMRTADYEFDYAEHGVKFVCNMKWGR